MESSPSSPVVPPGSRAAHAKPIYLITHEFFPKRGGIATFTEEIACACHRLGRTIEVWAQAAPGVDDARWPFPVRRLPLKGTHDLACQLRLARQLLRHRAALERGIVYLPEPGPIHALMCLHALGRFRPPHLVLTFHGSEIFKLHDNLLARPLTRRLIRNASLISTLSAYTRRVLCERFPEAAAKTILTPGALRTALETSAPPHPEARHRSPLRERLVVLTVGRLHPRKGQLLTLEALRRLPAAFKAQLEYRIVGTAPAARAGYEHALRAAAADAGFPVRFLGDVPDDQLGALYAEADVFALTSINHGHSVEGFGLVYLEASAQGVPVIAHDVGGVSEAVRADVTGLLVPPDQPEALTNAFARLLGDPSLRHRLGEAGRAWARRHTWTHAAQQLFAEPPIDARLAPQIVEA